MNSDWSDRWGVDVSLFEFLTGQYRWSNWRGDERAIYGESVEIYAPHTKDSIYLIIDMNAWNPIRQPDENQIAILDCFFMTIHRDYQIRNHLQSHYSSMMLA